MAMIYGTHYTLTITLPGNNRTFSFPLACSDDDYARHVMFRMEDLITILEPERYHDVTLRLEAHEVHEPREIAISDIQTRLPF